jgi:hypothetical protein
MRKQFKCPGCRRRFRTARGLSMHQKGWHEELKCFDALKEATMELYKETGEGGKPAINDARGLQIKNLRGVERV